MDLQGEEPMLRWPSNGELILPERPERAARVMRRSGIADLVGDIKGLGVALGLSQGPFLLA